jgi:uncharacterized protein
MPKDSDFIVIIAQSLDEALEKASNHFKKDRSEIQYEIIEKKDKIKIKLFLDRSVPKYKLKEDSISANGYFKIKYNDGNAILTVFPPKGKGIQVYPEEIVSRMKILNIPRINYDTIKQIIENATCKPEVLAPWPNGALYRASVDVKITDDKMKAFITLHRAAKEGAGLTQNEIMSELDSYGIKYGIDERLIEQMVLKNIYEREVCIASGKPVKNEEGVKIKYYFDINPGKPFLMDEYGKINLKELNLIQNKKKDDILAEIIEPVTGEDGINIFNEIVWFQKGQNADVRNGLNTVFSEDGLKIISLIDGHVIFKNSVVMVEPLVTVNDVNYETGNIDFDGTVLVNGTIADGFSVKAGGSIQVGQSVGKVFLEAGQDVILKAGMNGNHLEGNISCKGNIYARFIEGTNIECRGNLFAEEAVMNSTVKVGKNLLLVGRRAELIGGEAIIGKSLRCKKIGNDSGIKTKINIGYDPETLRLIAELKRKIEENKDKLAEILENRQKLEKIKTSGFTDIQKIEKSIYNYQSLEIRLKDEILIMEKDFKDAKKMMIPGNDSIILAESTIFPGTEITFGEEELKVMNREINKVILKLINGKIKESGFNYKEMPQFDID